MMAKWLQQLLASHRDTMPSGRSEIFLSSSALGKVSKHFYFSEVPCLIAQSTKLGHKLIGECCGLICSGNHSDKGFVIVLVDFDQKKLAL